MPDLYQTLGVADDATAEEIEEAYQRVCKMYMSEGLVMDASLKTYFDDISLAYKTIVNPVSRAEYDLYMSQSTHSTNRSNEGRQEEDDPEVVAERERRRRERGKKRYE